MDGDGNSKDDVKIPDTDLGKEIENAFNDGKDAMVTIIAAMGMFTSFRSRSQLLTFLDEEQPVSWKEAPQA